MRSIRLRSDLGGADRAAFAIRLKIVSRIEGSGEMRFGLAAGAAFVLESFIKGSCLSRVGRSAFPVMLLFIASFAVSPSVTAQSALTEGALSGAELNLILGENDRGRASIICQLADRVKPGLSVSEVVAALGGLAGLSRWQAVRCLAPRVSPHLNGNDLARIVGEDTSQYRSRMLCILADQVSEEIGAEELVTALGHLKGLSRFTAARCLASRVSPRVTGADLAQIIGDGTSYRSRMICALADRARGGIGAAEVATALGPLTGLERLQAVRCLEPKIKFADGLNGTDLVLIVGEGLQYRSAMLCTVKEHVREWLSAEETAFALDSLEGLSRLQALRCVAPRLSRSLKGDEFVRVVGEGTSYRSQMLCVLPERVWEGVDARDLAAALGPLTGQSRLQAIRCVQTAQASMQASSASVAVPPERSEPSTTAPPETLSVPTGLYPGSHSSPGTQIAGSVVTLRWNSVTGASEYDLGVRDMASGHLVVDRRLPANSVELPLAPERTYRWNVSACNTSGCSGFATPSYFTLTQTEDNSSSTFVSFVPPVIDFHVETQRYDAFGKVVAERHHVGIDYGYTSRNREIRTTAPGVVVRIQANGVGCAPNCNKGGCGCQDRGLGNTIILEHRLESARVFSMYAHLERFAANVSLGACLRQGGLIGIMGGTGFGIDYYPTHLHFEIKNANTLSNPSGPGTWFGYTPGPASEYGYRDPNSFFGHRSETAALDCP